MSTFQRDIFSAVGSDFTSESYLVADAAELTLSYDVDSETSLVIQGSNVYGPLGNPDRAAAFVEDDWSTLTTVASVTANDILNIEPGFRWLRCIRESSTSIPTVILHGRNVVRGMG